MTEEWGQGNRSERKGERRDVGVTMECGRVARTTDGRRAGGSRYGGERRFRLRHVL